MQTIRIQPPSGVFQEWLSLITANAIIVQSAKEVNDIVNDPDDNRILGAANEGNANFIVSRDNHLLILKEWRGIKIVNPHQFRDFMRSLI